MKIEEKILLEENELKPNRYIANALLYMTGALLVVELLNELDIFHVTRSRMRLCCVIVALCTFLAQVIGRGRLGARPKTKYYMMCLILIETLLSTVIVSQWTELVIAFPLLLSIQYHSKGVTRMAATGTLIIALIAAPLSAVLGMPQVEFYTFLIRSIGYDIKELSLAPGYDRMYYVDGLFKYMSVPRALLVGAFWPIAMRITELTEYNVQNRADATYYSSIDIMTGLFNRFSFEAQCERYRQTRPARLLCIYADADGLHGINNQFGHAAGDAVLKACAREMEAAFGELTYRIGGDEFLAFLESGSREEALAGVERIHKAMAEYRCHASFGVYELTEDMTIDSLIREAESKMYEAKRNYYMEIGHDRRKNRS